MLYVCVPQVLGRAASVVCRSDKGQAEAGELRRS
jgi:hypothetical protein